MRFKKMVNCNGIYENNGHLYHTTLPTDGIMFFRDNIWKAKSIDMKNHKLQIQLEMK